jgi:hypothetical protein
VADVDFINSAAQYIEKLADEPIHITRNGQDIAVLARPSKTSLTDRLVGILKDSGITCADDIKKRKMHVRFPEELCKSGQDFSEQFQ